MICGAASRRSAFSCARRSSIPGDPPRPSGAKPSAGRCGGAILIVSLAMMAVLFLLASAIFIRVPSLERQALRIKMEAAGLHAADAAIQRGIAYLAFTNSPSLPATQSSTTNGWATTVTIDTTFDGTVALPTDPPQYRLVGRATFPGSTLTKEVTTVVVEQTLAGFASFLQTSTRSDGNTAWLSLGQDSGGFEGPVYFGDQPKIFVPNLYYETTTTAPFRFTVMSPQVPSVLYPDGVFYSRNYRDYGNSPFGPKGEPDANRYAKLFKQGEGAIRTRAVPVTYPTDPTAWKSTAWGGLLRTFPTVNGLYGNEEAVASGYPRLRGGLVLVGTGNRLDLSVESGNQVLRLTQRPSPANWTTWIITSVLTTPVQIPAGSTLNGEPFPRVDPTTVPVGHVVIRITGSGKSGNEYQVYQFPDPAVISGGIVYVTGDLSNVGGDPRVGPAVLLGRLTVVAEGDLLISNHLTYNDTPPGTVPQPPLSGATADALGLVATRIRVASGLETAPLAFPAPSNLRIYGALLACHSFLVDDPVGFDGGTLHLWGSLAQKEGGGTQITGAAGEFQGGYALLVTYDTRLATRPPPTFPRIGKFQIIYRKISR